MQMKQIFYDWGGANAALFQWINGVSGPLHDALMLLGTLISNHRNFPVYVAAIGAFAMWRVRRSAAESSEAIGQTSLRWLAVIAVFSVAYLVDGLFVLWIKTTLAYPRPPLALPLDSVRILGEAEYKLSFPSGHASFAMALVASLWPQLNRWGRVAGALFLVWVALSRISVGAHFPADIVGSYVIALPITLAIRRIVVIAGKVKDLATSRGAINGLE